MPRCLCRALLRRLPLGMLIAASKWHMKKILKNKKALLALWALLIVFASIRYLDYVERKSDHVVKILQEKQIDLVHSLILDENSKLGDELSRQLAHTLVVLAENYEMDPLLVLALIKVESNFRPQVVSHAGAIGLMQVKPIVVREVEDDLPLSAADPKKLLFNPFANVQFGVHYLAELNTNFDNDWFYTLSAYNMGPTRIRKFQKVRKLPSSRYYDKVMYAYTQLRAKAHKDLA
jgi:soluble lytic murein transglycosylase